jgi:hypothetical protein
MGIPGTVPGMLVLPEEEPLCPDWLDWDGEPLWVEGLELGGEEDGEPGLCEDGELLGDGMLGDGMLGEGIPEEGVLGEGGGLLLLDEQPARLRTAVASRVHSQPPAGICRDFEFRIRLFMTSPPTPTGPVHCPRPGRVSMSDRS